MQKKYVNVYPNIYSSNIDIYIIVYAEFQQTSIVKKIHYNLNKNCNHK